MRAPIVNPFLRIFFFSPFYAKSFPFPPRKVGRIGKKPTALKSVDIGNQAEIQ